MHLVLSMFSIFLLISCVQNKSREDGNVSRENNTTKNDTTADSKLYNTTVQRIEAHYNVTSSEKINTGNTTPQEVISYAKTLIGIPYKYGSTDPNAGFDCSGFITHVFNHFKIEVPRSSVDFTNVQTEIPLQQAKPGDLILFTGTDSTEREVGHMGIIVSKNNNEYQFIHSTSGKQYGVTITPLNNYYMGRFMKVVRVFKLNDK